MNETEAICWIRGHVEGLNKSDYQFHPAVMDAVFQVRTDVIIHILLGDIDRRVLYRPLSLGIWYSYHAISYCNWY